MVLAQGQDGNTTVRLNICMSTEYSLRHSQNYHSLSHSQTFPTFYCYDGLSSAAVYSSDLTALHSSDLSLVQCTQPSSYDLRSAVYITALTGAQPFTALPPTCVYTHSSALETWSQPSQLSQLSQLPKLSQLSQLPKLSQLSNPFSSLRFHSYFSYISQLFF